MKYNKEEIIKEAKLMKEKAYAPYSKFQVGACLVTTTGEKFTGCNVENASYGLTICAERTAIVKAVSAGFTKFSAIAVASNLEKEISPCGACRQFITEFGGDIDVIMTTLQGEGITKKSRELLPYYFDKDCL